MNEIAFQKIHQLFSTAGVEHTVYTHLECRTSEESTLVRREAGMPDAMGAKALLCKVDFKPLSVIPAPEPEYRAVRSEFVVFVLPGTHVIDKTKLKIGLPDLKQFRFSTKEELFDIAGVVPGSMPPFGNQIFEGAQRLYISEALKGFPRIAFNAAKLDTSITIASQDYFKAAAPVQIFDFSVSK